MLTCVVYIKGGITKKVCLIVFRLQRTQGTTDSRLFSPFLLFLLFFLIGKIAEFNNEVGMIGRHVMLMELQEAQRAGKIQNSVATTQLNCKGLINMNGL